MPERPRSQGAEGAARGSAPPIGGRVIVTGASRGIGAATARDLAARGYRVAGLSRSGTSAAGEAFRCDVTDAAALAATIAAIAARGPVVGLVNGAGAYHLTPSAELSAAEFEATIRLDATSVLVACRAVRPHLIAAGGGLIVNIGSFFEPLGVPGSLAYCAAKAAVGAMTRCLAAEWGRDGIRVLDVAPGYIETDLNRDYLADDRVRAALIRRIPARRIGTAEEVGRFVGMLFAGDFRFLTGATLTIDGGHGMIL